MCKIDRYQSHWFPEPVNKTGWRSLHIGQMSDQSVTRRGSRCLFSRSTLSLFFALSDNNWQIYMVQRYSSCLLINSRFILCWWIVSVVRSVSLGEKPETNSRLVKFTYYIMPYLWTGTQTNDAVNIHNY